MIHITLTIELRKSLRKAQNLKSARPDRISDFSWRQLIGTHTALITISNEMVNNQDPIPDWLAEGITSLPSKSEDTGIPKNYRPITCRQQNL